MEISLKLLTEGLIEIHPSDFERYCDIRNKPKVTVKIIKKDPTLFDGMDNDCMDYDDKDWEQYWLERYYNGYY